jgi:chromosome segregation ATPase
MDKKEYLKWTKDRLAERMVDVIKQRDDAIDAATKAEAEVEALTAKCTALDLDARTNNTAYHEAQLRIKERDQKLERAEQEFREMNEDRDNWQRRYNECDGDRLNLHRLLIRQAHLAGELAKMTGNVDLMVTKS